MNVRRDRIRVIAALAGVACSFAVAAAADRVDGVIGEVDGTTLYLQAGSVDLGAGRRGLGEFIAAERALAADRLEGRHFVLQLAGPMRPAWRERLAQAGIVVGEYVPMNAFVVTLANADAKLAGGLEFVRWFGEYAPEWKLAPDLGRRPLQTPERLELDAAGKALVVITLFKGASATEVTRHVGRLPGAQAHWAQPIGGNLCVAATMRKEDLAGLATLSSVQFVEDAPELTVRNDTDRWIVQSNVVDSTPLYAHGLHGEGQILGLMDTRLDRNHCSFIDTSNPIGPLHRKIVAYNSSSGASFHGTHVAGTAVGDHNDFSARRGVAYMGRVAFNTIPSFNETDMENRLNIHHDQGARIHTNSWGDDGTTQYNSLCRGIDSFSYEHEDDLLLFAVTNLSNLKNPENAKNLLAVGASQDDPSQGNHCSGGNGPTNDQRRKPEIYAPGCGTNSAAAGSSCEVAQSSGTSMACPAVAGVGMLVRQYFVDGFYPSGAARAEDSFTPSGALIKGVLLNSAVDMTGIPGYPSTLEGWGRVLADDALYFEGDTRRLFVADVRNAEGLSTDEVVEYPLSVASGEERLKITLAWTEPAATAGTSFASVNDLDLEVVAPGDVMYKGNVFGEGRSVEGGGRDDRNNVEQMHLDAPSAGEYTIRVRATAVNQGTQGFALIATGDIGGTGCACDWNGSGAIDSQDLFDFLGDFFEGAGDFDGDGVTNSGDFFEFLPCFFDGCH